MSQITSKQRMKAAMSGEKPDQIPLMCQFSLGYLAQHSHMDLIDFWYTPTDWQKAISGRHSSITSMGSW